MTTEANQEKVRKQQEKAVAAQAEAESAKDNPAAKFPPETPAGESDVPKDAAPAGHFPGPGLGYGEKLNPARDVDQPPSDVDAGGAEHFPAPGLGHGQARNKGDAPAANEKSDDDQTAAPGAEKAERARREADPIEPDRLHEIEADRAEAAAEVQGGKDQREAEDAS